MTDAPFASTSNPLIDDARRLARGAARLLADLDISAVPEATLPCGRRADLMGVSRSGDIVIVEVKSGVADFRADQKWPEYADWCDRFYFAVTERFPHELIPPAAGLIIADGFGAAIIREAPAAKLAPARRKALTLRLARMAADRLWRWGEA
jgi:hypothetical protein